jgi:hypothetical protein
LDTRRRNAEDHTVKLVETALRNLIDAARAYAPATTDHSVEATEYVNALEDAERALVAGELARSRGDVLEMR